ncbi:MAG: efflux RND transporter periplasmic adaptor subunit [Planctomycetota bacterium]
MKPNARLLSCLSMVTLGVVFLTAGGCGDGDASVSAPPPPGVEVAIAEARDVTEYFSYTGNLEAVESVEVRARVPGFLEQIGFRESENVSQGDMLFVIEQDEYQVAVGRAEATLVRARAAASLAEARLERTRGAFEQSAANEFELLEDEAELLQANADLLQAERDLAAAELELSYTEIISPITGRIDRHYVNRGNLVGTDGATPLARVVTLDPMHVYFDVSETIALKYLDSGQDGDLEEPQPPVQIGLADEVGFPHTGMIDFVDNSLDRSTGTLLVRASVPNTSGKLYPGLFARIRVPWDVREGSVVVWEDAVGTGLDGPYVLVIDSADVVERRSVEVGERQLDGTIVILSGLAAGETYIVTGIQKARPGSTVDPSPYTPPGWVGAGSAGKPGGPS